MQLDIASKFESVPARGGRKFRYRNKRTGERDPNRIIVNMEEFTKTIHAFMFGPDDVYGGAQYLFDTSKDGGYLKIYGQGAELLPALTEAQFLRLLGIWFVCEYTRDRWKHDVETAPSEALERRWMVFFAVGESLRQVHERGNESLDHTLQKLANPAWYLEPDGCQQKAVLKRHCKLGFTALKNAYNEAKGQKDFRHRNWFRTQMTLESVRMQLANLWEIASENAEAYSFTHKK